MRVIPTRVHAVLDYIVGIVLAAYPYIVGATDRGLLEWSTAILGCSLIVYSLFTDYELAALRLIPLKVHLILDALGGVALIVIAVASPVAAAIWVPLVLVGIIEIGSSLMTQTTTSDGPGALSPSSRITTRSGTLATPQPSGPKTADGRPDDRVHPGSEQTVEQVRGAIDSGRTGDKIAVTDPAAAPLGSDAEAAQGHDEEGLATARRQPARPGA